MVNTPKALLLVVLAVLAYPNDIFGGAYQPEFSGPIKNLTVPLGRDATFTCLVKNLGGYRNNEKDLSRFSLILFGAPVIDALTRVKGSLTQKDYPGPGRQIS
ncbi:hypothetical protein M0802_016951 [Mischocyttarus mexicanus]|nr:hypothetical protein M0802_016951 [Mischocyttarus mexicanus]